MTFINVTPHAITLNDGRVFESVGVEHLLRLRLLSGVWRHRRSSRTATLYIVSGLESIKFKSGSRLSPVTKPLIKVQKAGFF